MPDALIKLPRPTPRRGGRTRKERWLIVATPASILEGADSGTPEGKGFVTKKAGVNAANCDRGNTCALTLNHPPLGKRHEA